MVKRATIARRHGTQQWDLVVTPDATLREHRAWAKQRRLRRRDPVYAEIWLMQPVRKTKLEPEPRKSQPAPSLPPPPPPRPQNRLQATVKAIMGRGQKNRPKKTAKPPEPAQPATPETAMLARRVAVNNT